MQPSWEGSLNTPLLQLRHITKRFPGVLALDDVSLSIGRGEVVALIGKMARASPR